MGPKSREAETTRLGEDGHGRRGMSPRFPLKATSIPYSEHEATDR